ncbi:MAG: hypothetical protein ACJA1B_001702 [Polaribacter sp.]|jgi:hypothetical protein
MALQTKITIKDIFTKVNSESFSIFIHKGYFMTELATEAHNNLKTKSKVS